ncbi:MAG TPA: hypothetical protein VM791_19455 [Vicinamibacterales bacterium]|jgi:hypothetical protein|nr:hypothetical protein [Vicinamibacterales bacterium]
MIRFYRALLRLYPSSFRKEYADEMTAAFAEAYEAATWAGRLGLFLRVSKDELRNALARLALLGIVPGVLGAYAAARGMSALLFGIQPGDPATFATAIGLALLMALAGSLLPALRAVRISPMSALKAD